MNPPQPLCASFRGSSLTTSSACIRHSQQPSTFKNPSFRPGDCYLFTRTRDYRLFCVFTRLLSASLLMSACSTFCLLLCPSSALFSVLSPAIECFRAALVAPRLLVVAARSRLPCVFLPQLKKGQNSKCLSQDFKTKQKQGPQHFLTLVPDKDK